MRNNTTGILDEKVLRQIVSYQEAGMSIRDIAYQLDLTTGDIELAQYHISQLK